MLLHGNIKDTYAFPNCRSSLPSASDACQRNPWDRFTKRPQYSIVNMCLDVGQCRSLFCDKPDAKWLWYPQVVWYNVSIIESAIVGCIAYMLFWCHLIIIMFVEEELRYNGEHDAADVSPCVRWNGECPLSTAHHLRVLLWYNVSMSASANPDWFGCIAHMLFWCNLIIIMCVEENLRYDGEHDVADVSRCMRWHGECALLTAFHLRMLLWLSLRTRICRQLSVDA